MLTVSLLILFLGEDVDLKSADIRWISNGAIGYKTP
jgi:hypothetical protein